MRRVSLDLQPDSPFAATSSDQLSLPLFDSPLSYRFRRDGHDLVSVRGEDASTSHAIEVDGLMRSSWRLVLLSRDMIVPVLDMACVRDYKTTVQTELLSE